LYEENNKHNISCNKVSRTHFYRFLNSPNFYLTSFNILIYYPTINFLFHDNLIISFNTSKIIEFKQKNNITKHEISVKVCIIGYKIKNNESLSKFEIKIKNKIKKIK
jgi:hypothetical protein